MEKGFILWCTGFECEQKGRVVQQLEEVLLERGLQVELLDSEIVKEYLCDDVQVSKEGLFVMDKRAMFVGVLLARNGVAAIVSLVSPSKDFRDEMRANIDDFVEVYFKCPIEFFSQNIDNLKIGEHDYEAPEKAEVVLDVASVSLEDSTRKILKTLELLGYIPSSSLDDYTDDEENEIKDRLENLGYL